MFRIFDVVIATSLALTSDAAASAHSSQKNEPTLCHPEEQILFSCSIKRGKIISFCASQNLSQKAGQAQYRFGRSSAPELVYPADPAKWSDVFRFSSTSFSGGGEYHVRFENAGYEYVLYDAEVRPEEISGLLVRAKGRVVSRLTCVDGAHSFFSYIAFRAIKREPYIDDVR